MPRPKPHEALRVKFDAMTHAQLVNECVRLTWESSARKRERSLDVKYVDPAPLGSALACASWTNLDLARALPCNRSTPSLWLRGHCRLPRPRAEQIVILFREYGQEPPAFVELKDSTCYTRPVTRKDLSYASTNAD